jgi:anti-anti-sigma factor
MPTALRDAAAQPAGLRVVTAVRFDGRLYFANVAFFEDAILEAVAANPKARYLLVVGDGINELDASGEEVMHHLVERLRSNGVTMLFSGLKKQVIDVMRATGLFEAIGEAELHITADRALRRRSAPRSVSRSGDRRRLLPELPQKSDKGVAREARRAGAARRHLLR